MTYARHLARNKTGDVIHRDDCRHARAPWHWADQATDDELLSAKMRMGYRTCKVCKPTVSGRALLPESEADAQWIAAASYDFRRRPTEASA